MGIAGGGVHEPYRLVLSRISNPVMLQTVMELGGGMRAFAQLRFALRVSPQALSRCVRELEALGLVEKFAGLDNPVGPIYRLSKLGLSLYEPLAVVERWAEAHADDILGGPKRDDGW